MFFSRILEGTLESHSEVLRKRVVVKISDCVIFIGITSPGTRTVHMKDKLPQYACSEIYYYSIKDFSEKGFKIFFVSSLILFFHVAILQIQVPGIETNRFASLSFHDQDLSTKRNNFEKS